MDALSAKGTEIGSYQAESLIKEDAVFRWVRVRDRTDLDNYVLQIPQPGPQSEGDQLKALRQYFNKLQMVQRKGLITPQRVLRYPDYPLVVVYPEAQGQSVGEALRQEAEHSHEWWSQVCEALHRLHMQDLVHGCISPESFIVMDVRGQKRAMVTDFGYGPLMAKGCEEARVRVGDYLAPEVAAGAEPTTAADVYGYAKTLASWLLELEQTPWYERATSQDPNERFRTMREVSEGLKQELQRFG